MSYQVLARKWRPNDFSEVVGQEHVVQALSNSLDNQKVHQAFVLSGTRGVGKTTIARTLACLLYTSPSPRDRTRSRMPSSA